MFAVRKLRGSLILALQSKAVYYLRPKLHKKALFNAQETQTVSIGSSSENKVTLKARMKRDPLLFRY